MKPSNNPLLQTSQRILLSDSRNLSGIEDASVDLVVTSPPYPMIAMWDAQFSALSPRVAGALNAADGDEAFESMHCELDKTWAEVARVLKNGAFACINIGDATRSIGDTFRLFPNHARVIQAFRRLRFDSLPVILWRKQTNAPNKFMGSGMLPAGAYVTLEHEYILVFRKGSKRLFTNKQSKDARMQSAFFWEERNSWFSDIWDFKGISQRLDTRAARERSAAYPFELAYRLINMYSLRSDLVLDPFAGTGTTMIAAIASGRNGIGVEIDESFLPALKSRISSSAALANEAVSSRIARHHRFVRNRAASKTPLKYTNADHGFPVMTRQETTLRFMRVASIEELSDGTFSVAYGAIDG